MLYVIPNTTHPASTPPPDDLVVPILQQLITTTGDRNAPVKDITITGVNFRDAKAVYEEQWEVPSGGDWALHRSAAIFLEGTVNAKVSGGLFKRLDGNAIMLNGFNRGATIEKNEFVYIADNVLAGWGETKEWDGRSVSSVRTGLAYLSLKLGSMCRNGDQPRNTLVQDNIIHEVSSGHCFPLLPCSESHGARAYSRRLGTQLGFFEKQSSAWFQAKTATTTIKNNIM